jgi:hypothetical protein
MRSLAWDLMRARGAYAKRLHVLELLPDVDLGPDVQALALPRANLFFITRVHQNLWSENKQVQKKSVCGQIYYYISSTLESLRICQTNTFLQGIRRNLLLDARREHIISVSLTVENNDAARALALCNTTPNH